MRRSWVRELKGNIDRLVGGEADEVERRGWSSGP
jgi:hypothetical protein